MYTPTSIILTAIYSKVFKLRLFLYEKLLGVSHSDALKPHFFLMEFYVNIRTSYNPREATDNLSSIFAN